MDESYTPMKNDFIMGNVYYLKEEIKSLESELKRYTRLYRRWKKRAEYYKSELDKYKELVK